jgi:hypothetical protein
VSTICCTFQLNQISLCKNILRAITANQTDVPPLASFPKSHSVTFRYYVGLIHFLDEDYVRVSSWNPPFLPFSSPTPLLILCVLSLFPFLGFYDF